MIVCHRKKFIFIHVPKTGGSSIRDYVENFLTFNDVNFQIPDTYANVADPNKGGAAGYALFMNTQFDVRKHSTLPEIRQKLGPEYFDQFFSFTFVRNPYARAYSAYKFTMKWDAELRPDSKRYQEIKDMAFENWLASPYVSEHKLPQTRPQTHWLPEKAPISFIGHAERYSEDMQAILTTITGDEVEAGEIVKRCASIRRNQSTEPGEWRSISARAADIIRNIYADDFDRFGYSREIS